MSETFIRTEMLIGTEGMERLKSARIAIFGIGGVGGYTAEALARSGVGALDLIDNDKVSESNLNRQIIALRSNIGQYKTDIAKARINDINSDCKVTAHNLFFMPDTADSIDFSQYDYVVDAIDTVSGKIAIAVAATEKGVPMISCMGTGNKLDPSRFEIADIAKTSVCPLAKVMRRELKKRNLTGVKVLYSKEEPLVPKIPEEKISDLQQEKEERRKAVPGSVSFVPSVAGLLIAAEVVKDILNEEEKAWQ